MTRLLALLANLILPLGFILDRFDGTIDCGQQYFAGRIVGRLSSTSDHALPRISCVSEALSETFNRLCFRYVIGKAGSHS
jgi:hypothetical protein